MRDVLILAIPAAAVLATLWWLRARWQAESLRQVVFELFARLLPGPPRTTASLRRTLVRRVLATAVHMPSNKTYVPSNITIRLAVEDYDRLVATVPVYALELDLAGVLRTRAARERWQLPDAGIGVHLEPDPALHTGWIPAAQARAPHTHTSLEDTHAFPLAFAPAPGPTERATATATTKEAPAIDETAWLVDARGNHHELSATGTTIGRGPTCTVRIDDPLVSREHAHVSRTAHGWVVTDTGSTNGTWVVGALVRPGDTQALLPSNAIRFGSGGPVLTFVTQRTPAGGPTLPPTARLEHSGDRRG
ncbi:FhaA domain-containing protein [Cellulomonas fimi]|uniref:FhaA domain-containing protein n=1 Tax=Cellulomonas fimi TaxID=1708 RepID=UPI0023581187|nr:FhaA domain-containing protein [Cellulomonas fimi]